MMPRPATAARHSLPGNGAVPRCHRHILTCRSCRAFHDGGGEGHANERWSPYMTVYLRLALGITFLAAVTDRFGVWGAPGAPNVSWGDFAHFLKYAAQVNAFLPPALIP